MSITPSPFPPDDLEGAIARVIDARVQAAVEAAMAKLEISIKDQVAEIDLGQWKVSRVIDAGKDADGMAWAK